MTDIPCIVHDLGRMPYAEAWALQNRLAEARSEPDGIDRLLWVEHPHTYTFGSAGDEANLLYTPAERERRGIELFRADRGGDITYHGDGQWVGYPILRLGAPDSGIARGAVRMNVVGYVRDLERAIIAALRDFGVVGKPIEGLTGVWVDTPRGAAKIAAIGVRVNARGVTRHGFAVNVNTDLSYFDGIIPCGIRDKGVTSLAALLGAPVSFVPVRERLTHHLGVVLGREMREEGQ